MVVGVARAPWRCLAVATMAAGIAAATSTFSPPITNACSSIPPADHVPCETLRVSAPATTFPANAHGHVSVDRIEINEHGSATSIDEALELIEPLVVERLDDGQWIGVEFALVDGEFPSVGKKYLSLANPQPGAHRIAWAGSTCEEQPDVGVGRLVGEFNLTAAASYPDTLGPIELEWFVEGRTYDLGDHCDPMEYDASAGVAQATLSLPEAWLPWADAAYLGLYLDGEFDGFRDVDTQSALSGTLTRDIEMICAAEELEAFEGGLWGPASGTHTVELSMLVSGFGEVLSGAAQYTVDCGDAVADDGGSDTSESAGGAGEMPGNEDDSVDADPGTPQDGDGTGGGDGSATPVTRSGCTVHEAPGHDWLPLLLLVAVRSRREPRRSSLA